MVVEHFAAQGQPPGTLYVANTAATFHSNNRHETVIASGKAARCVESFCNAEDE